MSAVDDSHGGMLPQIAFVYGDSAAELRGLTVDYEYSRGTRYIASFDGEVVAFTVVGHVGPDSTRPSTPPPLKYRARELRPGIVLVHWIVQQAAIHVSLIFDFDEGKVHVSAMMPPNRWEFFDTGRILSVNARA